MMKNDIKWIIVNILLGIQVLALLLMLPRFISDLGWVTIVLPIIVLALLVGSLLKNRTVFLLVFIWSAIIGVHALVLLVMNITWVYAIYLAFAVFQVYIISQTKLK
ncbi:hypothetical protein KY335_00675 [Candidatus Woesearchaeota archaeon]|nr:hypothetical protein [Candidatus Woesearchaeota archaeon]MBW3013737.1 hypothetical protein [Candidatus Woesearchaeota archaeon]